MWNPVFRKFISRTILRIHFPWKPGILDSRFPVSLPVSWKYVPGEFLTLISSEIQKCCELCVLGNLWKSEVFGKSVLGKFVRFPFRNSRYPGSSGHPEANENTPTDDIKEMNGPTRDIKRTYLRYPNKHLKDVFKVVVQREIQNVTFINFKKHRHYSNSNY